MFGTAERSPETNLAVAIVAQAYRDLFLGQIVGEVEPAARMARVEAMAFLTDPEGPWARSRERICAAFDFNPDVVRQQTIRWLEGEPVPPFAYGRKKQPPEGVETARALWEEQKAVAARRAQQQVARAQEKKRQRILAAGAQIKQASDALQSARLRAANAHHVASILSRSTPGPKSMQAACIEKVISVLADGPKSARDLFFALDGEHSPESIRTTLVMLNATRDGNLFSLPANAA